MSINLYYQIAVHEADGRLVRRRRKRRCHSFLGQFAQHLEAIFKAANVADVTDLGGTDRLISHPTGSTGSAFQLRTVTTTGLLGIVTGTDATAVLGTDITMGAAIVDGAGAGQMDYALQVIGAVAVGASSATVAFSRTATNNSGSTITVREVGIRSQTGGFQFQVIRDVLSVAEVVTAGQVLTVVYTLRIDV